MITIIVILFPGIIAAIIFDKITTHSRWDAFKFSLYSLVLGIFCYSLLQAGYFTKDIFVYTSTEIEWTWLSIWNHAIKSDSELSAKEIILAAIFSIPTALIASAIINHKIINKIATKLRVSQKFGDENLFSYYLNSKDVSWVYVRDEKEGITYQGLVVSFSESETYQELVLSDVSVFNSQDSVLMYEIPSIYICKKIGEFLIESVPKEYTGESHDE